MFSAVLTQLGDTAVSVVNGASATTGVVGVDARAAELNEFGQMARVDNGVRVAAGTVGVVMVGTEIVVNGEKVVVTATRLDQARATEFISYRKSRPA
jgi:hypothetical protein